MKKTVLYLFLVAALLFTSGCGQADSPAPGFTREDLYLNIDGAQYRCNINIETVISGLGSDYEYSEAMSCDYDGLDKTYIYETAEFYTWPMPDGDLVNEVYTESPAVSTSKGISVGATREEVLAAYGEHFEDANSLLVYRLSDSREPADSAALCFDLEDGMVRAIFITMQAV